MNAIVTSRNAVRITKFCTFSYIENGVILIDNKEEENNILFSELNKVYIRKCKISLLNKISLLSILFILISVFSIYLPIEIVLLVSILYIPLIVKMNTYKRYQFNLLLNDGNLFFKYFDKEIKQDYINVVNAIRKEIFDNQIKSNIQIKKPSETTVIVPEYTLSTLSIA